MTTYVVGTQSEETSETLSDYLETRVGRDDEVHVINSLRGGDQTDVEDTRSGEAALEALESALTDADAAVETHQLVRGNKPSEDLLEMVEDVDADELVIGIRKRNPTSKVVFGSTAQEILLNTNVPAAVVPLERV